jgi:LL-diaminopimelate aminotransferase
MLVEQAALSFERWTGIHPPIYVMRQAVLVDTGEEKERFLPKIALLANGGLSGGFPTHSPISADLFNGVPVVPLAHRMELFTQHFFARLNERVTALQVQGRDVIRLDEGSPDLPPAPHIIEALAQSARRADTHNYQPHRGFAELRQAWAEMYFRTYGVVIDPENEVLPLLGSKEGIFHLPLVLVDPGTVVLIPDPGYITYARGARLAGGELYPLPLLPGRDFLPDLHAVPPQIIRRAKLLWLNYPNNPTAATATIDFFTEAVSFASNHNLLLCHDAAYTQVTFDGYRAPSLLEVPGAKEVCIEFNTLSKSHNMAGWRVAAVLGNPEVIKAMYALKTNVDSGHFRPVMEAAVSAMTGDQAWLQARNEIYRQRRDVVMQALPHLGLHAETPRASLYVWFRIPSGQTSCAFAARVLEQAHVSLAPGSIFGPSGESYIRLSVTAPIERVEEAMLRLDKVARTAADHDNQT